MYKNYMTTILIILFILILHGIIGGIANELHDDWLKKQEKKSPFTRIEEDNGF